MVRIPSLILFLDHLGQTQDVLEERYRKTWDEYQILFEQEPQQGIWPDVSNVFSVKHEKMVHVNLFRAVAAHTVLQKNKSAYKSASVIENFY